MEAFRQEGQALQYEGPAIAGVQLYTRRHPGAPGRPPTVCVGGGAGGEEEQLSGGGSVGCPPGTAGVGRGQI